MLQYNEVDADQLLQSLQNDAGDCTLADDASEALEVGGLAERLLVLPIALDLLELAEQSSVDWWKAAQECERLDCLLILALLDQEPGSL